MYGDLAPNKIAASLRDSKDAKFFKLISQIWFFAIGAQERFHLLFDSAWYNSADLSRKYEKSGVVTLAKRSRMRSANAGVSHSFD